MAEIIWTEQALEEIENIAEFISKDSFKYAKIQVQLFFDTVELISNQPEIERIVTEIQKKKIRELIVGNYRIVNRIVNAKRIDILTVHNSRRLLTDNPSIKKYKSR